MKLLCLAALVLLAGVVPSSSAAPSSVLVTFEQTGASRGSSAG
jgi:hypothetical protein